LTPRSPLLLLLLLLLLQAVPPVIVCVASKRAAGQLEENIASMGWKEGRDYFHFA
jgi:hypothetical protein